MTSVEFWDRIFREGDRTAYSRVAMPEQDDPVLQAACKHFGDVQGKTLVDLGCGNGAASLFFASRGANVLSIDASVNAIRNLTDFCAQHDIQNVKPFPMRAEDIRNLERVHFVFGSMILHHIEPFATFASTLASVLLPGGKGFFWENNASSDILIWFRKHVVGRWWVPKFGDDQEFPLTRSEIESLRQHFRVEVEYPELYYFRLASDYLLRGHLKAPFHWLDRVCYPIPWLRRRSYRQYVYLAAG